MYRCVIKPSDVLLMSKTARQELNVLLMWSSSAKKELDLVESLIVPWKPNLPFFSLSCIWSLRQVNLKHKYSLIHISMNQITKVDCNAFLWESESGHISLLYHFRGDSTLFSWTANVRDWSKQKNSRSVDKDCDQFPWSEIRMIYTNFMKSSWLLVFNLEVTILQLSATRKPC